MSLINEWGNGKFTKVVLTLEVSVLGLICISNMGFDIPFIRQILGFFFLTFIPGVLILRILRLNKLDNIETVLYSVGLSLAFIMVLGFLINIFYPIIGISNPISTLSLTATLVFIVFLLCIIEYKYNLHNEVIFSRPKYSLLSYLLNPVTLFLILLPFISILGTYLVNYHQNNILLLLLILIIALIPIIITFTKFIPSGLYPLAIVSIAISLLWHWSLVSIGLTGYDSHHEYYFQNLVLINSTWNSTISSNVNSMLSITMLAPIYSLILNLESVWVFKVIYPVFYSLLPLTLFEIYRKQTDKKVAFMGSFFFMSFPLFFSEMTQLARQQVAELFLALLILLLLCTKIVEYKRSLLSIIFGFSIVISHYGLSYIFMLFLFIILPLLLIIKKISYYPLQLEKPGKICSMNIKYLFYTFSENIYIKSRLNVNFILLFITFCLSWYSYIGHSSAFFSAIGIFKHIFGSLYTDFFCLEARDPMIVQALGLSSMRGNEIEWDVARIFQQITQICIFFGLVSLAFIHYNNRFYADFTIFSMASMVVITMCVILPYFSSSLNMGRIYHIMLLFLAPFCILGGKFLFQLFFTTISKLRFKCPKVDTIKLVVVLILIPYFLFTTGFIFHLTGATPTSMPLTLYQDDWLFPTYPEVCTSKWLEDHISQDTNICIDEYGGMLLRYQGMTAGSMKSSLSLNSLNINPQNNDDCSYIFLRRWNVLHHQARLVEVQFATPVTKFVNLENITYSTSLNKRTKIYENGNTQVLGSVTKKYS